MRSYVKLWQESGSIAGGREIGETYMIHPPSDRSHGRFMSMGRLHRDDLLFSLNTMCNYGPLIQVDLLRQDLGGPLLHGFLEAAKFFDILNYADHPLD